MFAPPVAKPKTKAAEPQRSAVVPQRPSQSAVHRKHLLQRSIGNQVGLRLLAQRARDTRNETGADEIEIGPTSLTAQKAAPALSWGFSKIPLFAPGEPNQSRPRALLAAPQLPIWAKLVVGRVDDPLEHEADRVADQVMNMPAPGVSVGAETPQISRKCDSCKEEEEKLQKEPAGPRAADGEAPAIVHEVLRSSGQPLDAATRAFFEPRFGLDFSGVRVHADAPAAASARDVNAHAYTVGHSVVFGAGRYAPGTHEGRRLLAHELTHVVQQQAGRSWGPPPALLQRAEVHYTEQVTGDEAKAHLDRFDGSLKEIDKTLPAMKGPEADELRDAAARLRTLRESGRVTVWRTWGSLTFASYDNASGELRLHFRFGEKATWQETLIHEAIHAVHAARYPRLSHMYGEALKAGSTGKGSLEKNLFILLKKWKAWTEYWAYRREFEYYNQRQAQEFRLDPHETAMKEGDVKGPIAQVKDVTGEDFDPSSWTPPAKYHAKTSSHKTSGKVQRKCDACQGEEKLQKEPAAPQAVAGEAPAIVHEVLRSPGQPLDAATRAFFEPRFGQDFSRVRVHTGALAEQSARDVNAAAYTLGSNIVFGAGAFAPSTPVGRQLIAHELVHTVQQGGRAPAQASAGQVQRDTKHYESKGIDLGKPGQLEELEAWSESSYWMQKVLRSILVRPVKKTEVDTQERLKASPEERDAVLSVLWDIFQKVKPIKAELVRSVTIASRGAKTKDLSYQFRFIPAHPARKGKKAEPQQVEVSFEAEGAGATPVTAPVPVGPSPPVPRFSRRGFPDGNDADKYFKKFPDEKLQLFNFIDMGNLTPTAQIVTTTSVVATKKTKDTHVSTFAVSGTRSPTGVSDLLIEFIAERAPESAKPPEGYASKDRGDLALEEPGKDKAKLGPLTFRNSIPKDEVLPAKFAVYQYFQGGTRDAEVHVQVVVPGPLPRRVLYILKFHGRTNAVEVERIGEVGAAGNIDPAKIAFDLSRIPNYPDKSKDLDTFRTWLTKRYPGITPKGANVLAMKAAAEADIATGAVKDDWFEKNYRMKELDHNAAKIHLKTNMGWDAHEVRDLKDFDPPERKIVELALETLSDPLLEMLRGVPLARQRVFIDKNTKKTPPTYKEDKTTSGVVSARGSDRTIVLFDNMHLNKERLFVGRAGSVAPASITALIHEFGHVIEKQEGIKEAFWKRFAAAKAKFKTDPITWYAKEQPEKDFFTEAFAYYRADPKWMKDNLRDMFNWFDELSRTGKPPS